MRRGNPHPNPGANGAPFDLDAHNEAGNERLSDLSVEEKLERSAERRSRALSALDQFGAEHLAKGMDPPVEEIGEIPALSFLAMWADHHVMHLNDMLEALPERREMPLLQAWPGSVAES